MSSTISSPDHVEGESLTQEFTVERDGSAYPIDGATIEWYLVPRRDSDAADALIDSSSTGVSVNEVDLGAGRFDVVIDQDVTTGLPRTMWQRVVVDDSGSGKQIWGGAFAMQEV